MEAASRKMPAMATNGSFPTQTQTQGAYSAVEVDSPLMANDAQKDKKGGSWLDSDCTTSSNAFFQATMSVTLGVFVYEGTAYNLIFLGRVLPAMGKELYVPLFFVLFNLVWVLALWAYLKAFMTDPGVVPKSWHNFVREVGPALPVVPSAPKWSPGKATYCRKCSIPRPERAHHCNVSGFCVLRMDHYCPWINNCVGVNNHKFFLQLVVYGSMASLIGIATSLPELILCVGKLCGLNEGSIWQDNSLQVTDMVAFIMFGSLAIFLGILLAPMLFTHVPLAFSNVTAIEGNYDNMANPYHLGSRIANLEQILGVFGPDWFVPVMPIQRKGDGVSFPRWDEPLGPDDRPIADEEVLKGDQLWRVRYKVRMLPPPSAQDDFDPLKTLSKWVYGEDQGAVQEELPMNVGCVV